MKPSPSLSLLMTPLLLAAPMLLGACEGEAPEAAQQEKESAAPQAAPGPKDALATLNEFVAGLHLDRSGPDWKAHVPQPPRLTFDPTHRYFWHLETSEGPIRIRLMPDVAPMHVSSTWYLSQIGFYDGVVFHRVIPDFMAQGGDPTGTGRGGPGYHYSGEFSPQASHSKRGILSMANAGPGTDGSQFFITFRGVKNLDGKHTVFGEVVEGMDTLERLEKAGSASGATTKPLTLVSAKVEVE